MARATLSVMAVLAKTPEQPAGCASNRDHAILEFSAASLGALFPIRMTLHPIARSALHAASFTTSITWTPSCTSDTCWNIGQTVEAAARELPMVLLLAQVDAAIGELL
mmetsp:Transcript_30789/g.55080  ORF Transcript_30789/g.55080 Transcript_30789/m.55080 type:complete len:108 (+) Transcript_30789:76-399(+)